MVDRPIIFSGPMIQALLEGRKQQTRRLAWREKIVEVGTVQNAMTQGVAEALTMLKQVATSWQKVKPGDRLWVRESIWWHDVGQWRFAADKAPVLGRGQSKATQNPSAGKGIPSIHMPRWASRLTLVVTGVKMEPLHAITDADAIAEGIERDTEYPTLWRRYADLPDDQNTMKVTAFPRISFRSLWISLHGPESWPDTYKAPQEVVALSFTVHKSNIDSMEKFAR